VLRQRQAKRQVCLAATGCATVASDGRGRAVGERLRTWQRAPQQAVVEQAVEFDALLRRESLEDGAVDHSAALFAAASRMAAILEARSVSVIWIGGASVCPVTATRSP